MTIAMFAIEPDAHDDPARAASADRLLADAARAAHGARERLDAAVVDLFLAEPARLTDRQRTMMTRLLGGLVDRTEAELRTALAGVFDETPALAAALADPAIPIAAPALARARVLRDPDLIAILLRRAEDHRLSAALKMIAARDGTTAASPLDAVLGHREMPLAEAAAALLIAESRRHDSFGDPLLVRSDLPGALQHRLLWWVAAALRDHMTSVHAIDAARADGCLVAAARTVLDAQQPGETLDARAYELAALLHRQGLLDDAFLLGALYEGRLLLAATGLAVRAAIDAAVVWDMLVDRDATRLAVLLRAIEMDRAAAASLLVRLFDADDRTTAEDDAALVARIDGFTALPPEQARDALRPWRLDDDYRRAVARLAAIDGAPL